MPELLLGPPGAGLRRDRLMEVLRYDADSGLFSWKKKQGHCKAGDVAGSLKDGYVRIGIDGCRWYRAHRLAWLYVTGKWPEREIDHKNGIKTDNRFSNLRLSDRFSNLQNQRAAHRNSSTGKLGSVPQGFKFRARITHNGRRTSLGMFETAHEAHLAYLAAKRKLHQGCTL